MTYLLRWFLFAIFLPLLIGAVLYELVSVSFVHLGLSGPWVLGTFGAIVLGSVINIPLWQAETVEPGGLFRLGYFVFYEPPHVNSVVIAANVGGALVPAALSGYLLLKAPLMPSVAATFGVGLVAFLFAQVVPGKGVVLNLLVPPLAAVSLALALSPHHPAAVAFIAGTLGTLAGADLMHLPDIFATGEGWWSIGGAGVFDGVLLVGVISAFLAA